MKARIINQNYTATSDVRVLARLPYTTRKPWLARIGPKLHKARTHEGALRWAEKQIRKGTA